MISEADPLLHSQVAAGWGAAVRKLTPLLFPWGTVMGKLTALRAELGVVVGKLAVLGVQPCTAGGSSQL